MKKMALESKMESLMQHWTIPQHAPRPQQNDHMDIFVEDSSAAEQDGEEWKDESEEGYVDGKDNVGANKVKQDTKGEAQRLYESWSTIIPNLLIPLLTYMGKSIGKPTCTSFETSLCQNCDLSLGTMTWIICLFWDCKYNMV